jgi:hypothetical protein
LVVGGSYNFNVDWGDGSDDDITVWNQAETTHQYASSGTYTLKVTPVGGGHLNGFSFNESGDRLKLINVSQWGTALSLGNTGGYFEGTGAWTNTASDTLTLPANCSQLFRLSAFNSSVANMDASGVTNMTGAFQETTAFNQVFSDSDAFSQDLYSWDVASCTNFESMFQSAVFNSSLADWELTASNVSLKNMFNANTTFNQPLTSWTTSGVTDLDGTFKGATAFN